MARNVTFASNKAENRQTDHSAKRVIFVNGEVADCGTLEPMLHLVLIADDDEIVSLVVKEIDGRFVKQAVATEMDLFEISAIEGHPTPTVNGSVADTIVL